MYYLQLTPNNESNLTMLKGRKFVLRLITDQDKSHKKQMHQGNPYNRLKEIDPVVVMR